MPQVRRGSRRDSQHRFRRRFAAAFGAVTIVFFPFLSFPPDSSALDPVRHEMKVRLFPDRHALSVRDYVTLPDGFPAEGDGRILFSLHAGLAPKSSGPEVRIEREGAPEGDPPFERYAVKLPPGTRAFAVEYGGTIDHPIRQVGEESARELRETPGTVGPSGIYLGERSGWYPRFDREDSVVFRLEIEMPSGWSAVSQGERSFSGAKDGRVRTVWSSRDPQEEILLVGGRYSEYGREAGNIGAMVFLREPDEALASRYLAAALSYLKFYGELIGPYPYPKFALVENFWETGYGMPSFTLLGSAVIRLPFIVETSYPHEILHNWWGNGVRVAYGSGNWCEGLTAYLSDHLGKERAGTGTEFRRTTLQKYADYVLAGRDLPLSAFRYRRGAVTEAVGYGKSLMLFHMLRLSLGDDVFVSGLRTLYKDRLFRNIGFPEVRRSFEDAAGIDLAGAFLPWVERAGAPRLHIGSVRLDRDGADFRLRGVLSQTQEEEPFPVRIPLVVTLEGREEAVRTVVGMKGRETELDLSFRERPLRVDVDPEFDVFRRLDRGEIPPAFTKAFGASRVLVLLPSGAGKAFREAYGKLAESLRRAGPADVTVGLDSDIASLPKDRTVWLLGWENRFLDQAKAAAASHGAEISREGVRLEGTRIPREGGAFALAVRHPGDPDLAILWVAADDPDALPGLGRKLPHYHKYSFLAFAGKEPANTAKGWWPPAESALTVHLTREDGTAQRVPMGKLAPRSALGNVR
jgi:hypothetical protein